MPPAGFEPTNPASERLQTHVLDRAATGVGSSGGGGGGGGSKNKNYDSTFPHYRKLVKISIKPGRLDGYKSTEDYLKTQPTKLWKYLSSCR